MGKVSFRRRARARTLRRVELLASVLDRAPDHEVTIRPWQYRLPRLAVLRAAQSRGFHPVGGPAALRDHVWWHEPMRFTRDEHHATADSAAAQRQEMDS